MSESDVRCRLVLSQELKIVYHEDCIQPEYLMDNVIISMAGFCEASTVYDPLVILRIIQGDEPFFKLNLTIDSERNLPFTREIYSECLRDKKVVIGKIGDIDLLLLAMRKKAVQRQDTPLFWCFLNVTSTLYNSCMKMLDQYRLALVLELDEILMKCYTKNELNSKMNDLEEKFTSHSGPGKDVPGVDVLEEIEKDLIEFSKQADSSEPPQSSEDKTTIWSRLHPTVPDSAKLFKIRPFWDKFRDYIYERFEIFVCTRGDTDHALQSWKLLDDESRLVSSEDVLSHMVSVGKNTKKDLREVFKGGLSHPNLAIVIDDRLDVWRTADRESVLQIKAFEPYDCPEDKSSLNMVLEDTRYLINNIRVNFFRYLNGPFVRSMSDVFYEDDLTHFASAPTTRNFF